MVHLDRNIDNMLEVRRDSDDKPIAVYAPQDKERAELVVRLMNSEYEAIAAYFAQSH